MRITEEKMHDEDGQFSLLCNTELEPDYYVRDFNNDDDDDDNNNNNNNNNNRL